MTTVTLFSHLLQLIPKATSLIISRSGVHVGSICNALHLKELSNKAVHLLAALHSR